MTLPQTPEPETPRQVPLRDWTGANARGGFLALLAASGAFLLYLLVHEIATWHWVKASRLDRTQLVLERPTAKAVDGMVGLDALETVHAHGGTVFGMCIICHSEQDGEHRYGPSLHSVAGAAVAKHLTTEQYPYRQTTPTGPQDDQYRYSAAFHELQAKGMVWSLPALWSFVYNQRGFVSGSRMPFPGLAERSNGNGSEGDDQSPGLETPEQDLHGLMHYLAWGCKPACGTDLRLVKLDIEPLQSGDGTLWTVFRDQPHAHMCEMKRNATLELAEDPSLFLVPAGTLVSDDLPPCAPHEATVAMGAVRLFQ